jgi:cell pole-organizing protein PopZ
MSDSKQGGGEPSMEEILASIRKIISEDTAEEGTKAGQGDDGAASRSDDGADADAGAETDSVGGDILELSEEAGDSEAGDEAPLDLSEEVDAGTGDDEPLELDEQVDGDGATAVGAQDAANGASEEAQEAEADADDTDRLAARPSDDAAEEAETAGGPATPETDGVGEASGAEDETPFLADPFDAGGGKAPDTAAEAALAAGAMAGAGGAAASEPQSARRSDDTASPLGPEDQRVISESAEQQAVEQLTSLAKQAEGTPGDTTADNVDHVLARMVRDALRPQLREWMDRNLPQIVERIVREEVQRMTHRAQGLDDDTRY